MSFPLKEYSDKELLIEFKKLQEFSESKLPSKLVNKKIGYKCSNAFFQYERMNTPSQGKISCVDYWKNKTNRDKVMKYKKQNPKSPLFNIIQFFNHPPSQFPSHIAIQIYKKFNATSIFDPFAGWGDRCLAAMAMNIDYTGVDSNKNLKPLYKDMVSFYPSKSKVKMFYKSCIDVKLKNIEFDFVLTSPPYWNDKKKCIEVYNHLPEDDYETFMNNILIQIIHKCRSKAKWSCFNVPENMAKYIFKNYGKCDKIISFSSAGNKIYQTNKIYCFKIDNLKLKKNVIK
jgi:16S rRNA G966 N2-methylase RsmD